jgi:DNA-binding transcriptional regulator YdaS (Cro superfamily)
MNLNQYFSKNLRRGTWLARAIGVSPVVVSLWNTGARQVPAERCPDIEAATGGLVRCEDLRPDVQWSVLRGSEVQAPVNTVQAATETVAQGV